MPTSVTVEIEFTAGVWTDVTAYLDGPAGGSTRFGRTSPYGATSPGTLSLTLANEDGRFTPRRQVLADGVTTHPYWPNVVPRKRIRVAYVVAGVPYYRFVGYIKGWPPSLLNGDVGRVTISAVTRDDLLARTQLEHLVVEEHQAQATAAGGTNALWLMNDPLTGGATSTEFDEKNGGVPLPAIPPGAMAYVSSQNLALASGPLPSSDGLQCVSFTNGAFNAQTTVASIAGTNFAAGMWVTAPVLNSGNSLASFGAASLLLESSTILITAQVSYPATPSGQLAISASAFNAGTSSLLGVVLNTTANNDGQPHHVMITCTTSGGTQTLTLYVDGVNQGSTSFVSGQIDTLTTIIYGGTASTDTSHQNLPVVLGPLQMFWGVAGYGATLVTALNGAGQGFPAERSDQRIARVLAYAGLAVSDYTLDTGVALLNPQPIAGQDVVSVCQAVVESEGGGAAFYAGADGVVRFASRDSRKPVTPAVTVDAEADLDGSSFQPVFDDTQIVNQVQGTKATADSTGRTQTVSDTASQTTNGLSSQAFTSYANRYGDVLVNAQDRLARQRNPIYQFGQLAIDLATATTAGLYAAVAGATIGSRLRATNLPATAAPVGQVDVYAEGWSDAFGTDGYTVTFDTSPADAPAMFVWEDATYGRWGCDGQTLNTTVTAAATTILIASTAGLPTFTTDPTMYPLTVVIGEEHIRLNTAPSGSTSPQTFTGATRGADSTTAAAQPAGGAIDLAPTPTWTF